MKVSTTQSAPRRGRAGKFNFDLIQPLYVAAKEKGPISWPQWFIDHADVLHGAGVKTKADQRKLRFWFRNNPYRGGEFVRNGTKPAKRAYRKRENKVITHEFPAKEAAPAPQFIIFCPKCGCNIARLAAALSIMEAHGS